MDTYKTAKIPSVTSTAVDIIKTVYYIHGPQRDRRTFAVLNVSIMCLTRCYKTTVFLRLYIHYWKLLPSNEILTGAKFTFGPNLAFFYIGSVTARQSHSSSGRQPNFAAFSRGRHPYSAGWPSRWASAHILVVNVRTHFLYLEQLKLCTFSFICMFSKTSTSQLRTNYIQRRCGYIT